MKFVQIRHTEFGSTVVPESRVPHLGPGWAVVEELPAEVSPATPELTDPEATSKPAARRSLREATQQ